MKMRLLVAAMSCVLTQSLFSGEYPGILKTTFSHRNDKKHEKASELIAKIESASELNAVVKFLQDLSVLEARELLLVQNDKGECALDKLLERIVKRSVEMQWGGIPLDVRLMVDRELWA